MRILNGNTKDVMPSGRSGRPVTPKHWVLLPSGLVIGFGPDLLALRQLF